MRHHTHIIIRILTVILLLTNVSGGGNLAYAGDDHKTYLEAFHAYMVYRNHSTPEEELTVLIPGVIVGIDKIILEDEAGEQSWYDLNGRRIDKPQKGVNILRTASGKIRKVVIK